MLAAVCPGTGDNVAMIAPHLDTDIVNVFLQQLAASLPADVHAALIWDGAGYHKSGRLNVPENITLIALPPYSPQLNPIENLWHYLRSHYWSNRFYADYDALDAAACAAWQQLLTQPDLFKTVCAAA
jgi:transposase